jgi:tRNA(Arg) A34 adenosine deaminase TadA
MDKEFMKSALKEAEIALNGGEVPVGCVFVSDGRIIGRGSNQTNVARNVRYHVVVLTFKFV